MNYIQEIRHILSSGLEPFSEKYFTVFHLGPKYFSPYKTRNVNDQEKGVIKIIESLPSFFNSRSGIDPNDWIDIRERIMLLLKLFLEGKELDPTKYEEWNNIQQFIFHRVEQLAKSGKYDVETVQGWFEMGY